MKITYPEYVLVYGYKLIDIEDKEDLLSKKFTLCCYCAKYNEVIKIQKEILENLDKAIGSDSYEIVARHMFPDFALNLPASWTYIFKGEFLSDITDDRLNLERTIEIIENKENQ